MEKYPNFLNRTNPSGFCKAIKDSIPDEEKDRDKYKKLTIIVPNSEVRNIIEAISEDEKRHGEIDKRLYEGYCK